MVNNPIITKKKRQPSIPSNNWEGPSWLWSHGSWIYHLSPLMLWVRIWIRARCTTLCDKVCQWLATSHWFSPGPPVSSTNKADRHDITDILLKVALNTIKQINKQNHIVKPGKNIVGNRGHKKIYAKGKKIHCHLRNEYYVTGHTVHNDDRIIS